MADYKMVWFGYGVVLMLGDKLVLAVDLAGYNLAHDETHRNS